MSRMKLYLLAMLVVAASACSTSKKTAEPVRPSQPVVVPEAPVGEVKDTVKAAPALIAVKSIILLLPLDAREQLASDTITDQPIQISSTVLPALNFLEGALIAVDSLLPLHVRGELKIVDTGTDSVETVRKLNELRADSAEAIISLLPSGFNALLAARSDSWAKPVFIFQAGNTGLLEKHPQMRLATASNSTQIRSAAGFVAGNWPSSRFIMIYRDQRGEDMLASLYASVIDSVLAGKVKSVKLNYRTAGWNGIKDKLDKSKRNILVIPTTDESFLSSLLNKISEVKNDYPIMLFGLPVWEAFQTIEPSTLTSFNTHLFNNIFIDFNQPATSAFRKAFLSRYHGDPLPQAFLAYDLVRMIMLGQLSDLKGMEKPVQAVSFPAGGYRFNRVCEGCGLENGNVSILRYGDYVLQRVNP